MPSLRLDRSKIKEIKFIYAEGGITAKKLYDMYDFDYLMNGWQYDTATGINLSNAIFNCETSGYMFSKEGFGVVENAIEWMTLSEAKANNVKDFGGGNPTLVKDGKEYIDWGGTYSKYIDGTHYRGALCKDKDNVFMVLSDKALTLKEFAKELIDMGVLWAINLDGGGSCHLQYKSTILRNSTRANASWILVYMEDGYKKMDRVVFDIGHGNDTSGKGIGTFKEHDFNSAVVVAATKLAELNGFEVILSQQPYSKEVKLYPRIDYIKAENSKDTIPALISFHANANDDTKVGGHGVFYWYNSTKGLKLAGLWNKYAKEELGIGTWGTGVWASNPNDGWSNFAILRETPMPAILAEHFFFTNPQELAKCNTPEFISKCARVVVKTICEYYGKEFADYESVSELDQALVKLRLAGVTNSPQYWKDKTKEVKYLEQLLINMSKLL